MANLSSSLNIVANGRNYSFANSESFSEVFDVSQDVDANDNLIEVATFSPTSVQSGKPSLSGAKFICIYNEGNQPLEIMLETKAYANGSGTPDTYNASVPAYLTSILKPTEYHVLANNRQIVFNTNLSATNYTQIDDKLWTAVNSSNLYSASIAQTSGSTGTGTSFTIDDGKKVKVGDILQIDSSSQEYVRVISITDDSADGDFTTATLEVERALFGGASATNWSTGTDIYLPMWNQVAHKYNAFTKVQTDGSGRYECSNLFGDIIRVGGGTDNGSYADGAVQGSIAIKFYNAGYQEWGMSGLNSSTNSGLTASTTYYFTIAVDGGSTKEISFTTGSNVKFGGSDGIIQKIQDALDAEFYDATSPLFEKTVTLGLTGGDLRFTSGQRLSTSAIALTTGTSGTSSTNLIGNAIGRFPASTETARGAYLPDDTITKDGQTTKNLNAFMMDDGYGNLSGAGTGSIDYFSGAISFTAVPNAEFVVSVVTGSALGNNTEITTIDKIKAKSTNPKRNGRVRVIAFN